MLEQKKQFIIGVVILQIDRRRKIPQKRRHRPRGNALEGKGLLGFRNRQNLVGDIAAFSVEQSHDQRKEKWFIISPHPALSPQGRGNIYDSPSPFGRGLG
jgi:hypothetical protein